MKRKKIYKQKNIFAVFLCFLVIFHTLVTPVGMYAADYTEIKPDNYIYWKNLGTVSTTDSIGYHKLDISNYGANMTTDTHPEKQSYDTMHYYQMSRVAYQKKIAMNQGVSINLTGSIADTGEGAANNANTEHILWNVMEWNAQGGFLYDSGWLYTNQTYTVGTSTTGTAENAVGDRSTVAYITLIFRYLDESGTGSSGFTVAITPADIASYFPNLYLCYKPFTYTIKGSSNATLSRLGTESVSISAYKFEEKTGYTTGWKITSDSALSPNWMNGNTYLATQVDSWLSDKRFYNTLFGNVTFTAVYIPNTYSVSYHANGGTTSVTSKIYTYGASVDLSPSAEKEGYTFIGWSTSDTAKIPLSSLAMPATNVTLYAVYTLEVSDVENHHYPDYAATDNVSNDEVYLLVWIKDNPSIYKYYPLTYQYDTNTMVYKYKLPSTDISTFTSGREFGYQLRVRDNAGNEKVLKESGDTPPSLPKEYLQTVKHYKQDATTGEWIWFKTTTSMMASGTSFTPDYVVAPMGYSASSKDAGGTVTTAKTYNVYYKPNTYSIQYHANSGSGVMPNTSATYDAGVILRENTFEKTGYTFEGWSTTPNGKKVYGDKDSVMNLATENGDIVNLYAVWSINSYTVTYDYWTNGGTSASADSEVVTYGSDIDLSFTAEKEGYTFVGWNTVPTKTVKLDSLTMGTEHVTLYAIFEKTITLTLVENSDLGTVITKLSDTIYNNDRYADFLIEEKADWKGWENIGWTDKTGATEDAIISTGATYTTEDSVTLYALYISDVTVSYDTNGSLMKYDSVTKECYYNASGYYHYPTFRIENAPVLFSHSFDKWVAEDGTEYTEDSEAVIEKDTVLTARWDRYPVLSVCNRYFTLSDAKNGVITRTELLKKVKATDKEDGMLVNGTDVVIKDYNAATFTDMITDGEVEITYQATDSFGNVVTKTITVTVTDTTVKKSMKKTYVRFINREFFADEEGNLISADKGGLEETSIWRINPAYKSVLERTLAYRNDNMECYSFTFQDIKWMKEYTNTHGSVLNSTADFFEFLLTKKIEK
ncbi:MAG: InlB B-repeat-containing protein [Agathobacter sp.]|nr:InlB B-repeat-containing protein [Agathobacter sp.]